MKTELELRRDATAATQQKYSSRPFKWGEVDCIRMARSHAVKMGHKPPRVPRYSTPNAALLRLRRMGFDTVDDLLASMFPKIPLASARMGDFVVAEGEAGIDAVFISLGRKIMGFHTDAEELVVVDPEVVKSAYRV